MRITATETAGSSHSNSKNATAKPGVKSKVRTNKLEAGLKGHPIQATS
jgi:hypothetical protein